MTVPPSDDQAAPACIYCGLSDHTGREHFQFVMALSEGADDNE